MTDRNIAFKRLLKSQEVEFLMEAHDGISAKIVEETGFKCIWASGLCLSASMGVRDSNEASWTQILEILEFMSDATNIPIMLDADTGYGNFNNVRRLVQKLEQRNISAMCIEDKIFPKTNSFINGEQQTLADINEFCGKIKAAKDTQQDSNFCVIARTEAFIVGKGLEEALKRAEAYYQAGADALLIHSKLTSPTEVLAFMKEWHGGCPIVAVPTTYYKTPVQVFADAGIGVIIWANHLLRSSIAAMANTARKLFTEKSVLAVNNEIAPIKEIFRLQNADELKLAEQTYLIR